MSPPPAATCQLCQVSRRERRNDYTGVQADPHRRSRPVDLPSIKRAGAGRLTQALGIAMAKTRDHSLRAFVQEVTAMLLIGSPHRTPGFGTFSICTRRATPDRCASTMSMFRASANLRDYASGGPLPTLSGRHAPAVRTIIRGMLRKEGITIPQLGRMAVVRVSGSKPKLIFHGAGKLNAALARLTSSTV